MTVFGPVVNLASRLQDMTKLLRGADPPRRTHGRSPVPRPHRSGRGPRPPAGEGEALRDGHGRLTVNRTGPAGRRG